MEPIKEKVKHGNSDLACSIYYNDTTNGYKYYMHWHEEVEIIHVLEGEANISINFEEFTIKKDDIIFINPDVIHNINPKNNFICKWKAYVFNLKMLSSVISDRIYMDYILPIINHEMSINTYLNCLSVKKELLRDLKLIDCFYSKKEPFYEIKIRSLLFDLFFQILKSKQIIKEKLFVDKQIRRIRTALEYIHSNYKDNITVSDVAKSCYINEFYFMKMFKKIMGLTVNEYICEYRMQKAYELILNTNKRVNEIAYECGFNSTSYFIEKFKKSFNLTPNKIREKDFNSLDN